MPKSLLLIIFYLITVLSCAKSESPSQKKTAEEVKPLYIGLLPEQNIFKQMERYEPLARYLSEKTGREIVLKILPRYGNIIDNFVSSNLDGAFFGSFTYALAHAKLGLVPLARPEGLNGVSTYHGLIFVRTDSRIRSAKDMKGKRFAFVDKATTAGYLLPLEYFAENGIRNYRTYLKEFYFTGTHEDAIYDVLNGQADIGAAKNTVFERLEANDSRLRSDLVVLARSPEVPENGLAVRNTLDASLIRTLKDILLHMQDDPAGKGILEYFGARRFIETRDEDYRSVIDYSSHINLDLSTYDYRNE
jgi:phosphonate transport system substrate-binding protein